MDMDGCCRGGIGAGRGGRKANDRGKREGVIEMKEMKEIGVWGH